MHTDLVNITTQEEDKAVEETIHSNVVAQTMKNPNEDFVTNSMTLELEVNQNIATHMIKEIQTRRIPYIHLNHKNKRLNQSTNLYHSKHKQKTYVSKRCEVCTIQFGDNNSSQVSSKCKIPQKIDLRWSNHFLV